MVSSHFLPARGVLQLLERINERFGSPYVHLEQAPIARYWWFLGKRHYWREYWILQPLTQTSMPPGAAACLRVLMDSVDAAVVVETCRQIALSRNLRLEMLDGLGLAALCTPDAEETLASKAYEATDPISRVRAALEVILEVAHA